MIDHLARDLAATYVRRAIHSDDAVTTLKELVEEALAGLGPSANRIAETLTAQHVRGHVADREQNPVARHLMAALGATQAAVDYISVTAMFALPDGGELSVEDINLPQAIGEFLTQFDAGQYEHLIDFTAARPLATRYLRSEANDTAGLETVTRETLVEVVDRRGTSDPIPDALVAAIGAAGLDAEDLISVHRISVLRLYRGDLCVALVQGHDDLYYQIGDAILCSEGEWAACPGYQFCTTSGVVHRPFPTRDEALRHALDNLGETCPSWGAGSC